MVNIKVHWCGAELYSDRSHKEWSLYDRGTVVTKAEFDCRIKTSGNCHLTDDRLSA